jgi:hypothetical protein
VNRARGDIARTRGATGRWDPLALVPLALTAWVYYPLTRVYFWGDDFLHLSRIASGHELAFILAPFAGHNYHLRNLAFIASWHLFGLHAAAWYWTVLLTHLLNVWLLFGVLAALTASARLACLGAAMWGMCPVAVGTLGVYSVYGHAMATTILLIVTDGLARRSAGPPASLPSRTALLWFALLLGGTTCFGIGVGVALAFPLVLFLLLPGAWRQRGVRLAYLALPAVTLAAYFALKRLSALVEPLPAAEFLQEYLAVQGLRFAPAMLAHLLGFAIASSLLGFFFRLDRYPDALDCVAILVFAGGLGLIAWRGDAKVRRTALAMVVLALGAYAVVAVGRAGMSIALWHSATQAAAFLRYHYLGTVPIVVLFCQMLQQAGRIGLLSRVPRDLALAAGLGLLVIGKLRSPSWIIEHTDTRAWVAHASRDIADAVAAAPPGTTVYVENGATPAIGIWPGTAFPGRAGVFQLISPASDEIDGRRVRFIERDPKILAFWAQRPDEPIARLLVSPEHAGGSTLRRPQTDGATRSDR